MRPLHCAVLCNFLILAVFPATSAQDLPPEPKSTLSHAQVTLIRAGRLVDPDSATVLTDQEILIAGNKVTAVGKQLRRPKDAKLIDLSDKTVLPGLIDCHTHLVDALMAVNGDPFNVVKKTAAQMVLAAVPNALSGLTSVRDVPFTVTHCSYEVSLSIGARVCCPD